MKQIPELVAKEWREFRAVREVIVIGIATVLMCSHGVIFGLVIPQSTSSMRIHAGVYCVLAVAVGICSIRVWLRYYGTSHTKSERYNLWAFGILAIVGVIAAIAMSAIIAWSVWSQPAPASDSQADDKATASKLAGLDRSRPGVEELPSARPGRAGLSRFGSPRYGKGWYDGEGSTGST